MNKILFLILVCKNVIASDEEINEKYIDLLPEEEKQEFLNRIARRILEGIQNNDTPKASYVLVDITDDQLDAHDAFVKEIIKEESDNLKNEKRRSENNEVNKIDRIEINNDSLNENNDGEVESNTGYKKENIDLTLREGKGQKKTNGNNGLQKEATTEISYDVIPVKTVYDEFENDDVKVVNKPMFLSLKENNTLALEQKGNLKNQERLAVSNLENSNNLILANNTLESDSLSEKYNKIEKSENSRKSFNKFELGIPEMVDFEPNSNETANHSITDEETMPLPTKISKEITDSTNNDTWGSIQKTYNNESEEKGEDFEEKITKSYNTKSNNIKETTTINPADVTEPSERMSTTKSDISLTESTIETTSKSISLSTIDNTSPRKPISEVVNDTQSESKDMGKFSIHERASTRNEHSMILGNPELVKNLKNEDLEIFFVSKSGNISISKDTVNVKTIEHNTERANLLDELDSNKLSNKTVLRARPDNLDELQIENESIQNIDEDSNKVKAYEVYEVDPNQPHFITTGKHLQNEHPLYAPVYNYAPENAYFRPYNKFGPNIEDYDHKDTPESSKDKDSKQFNLIDARNRLLNNDKKRAYYDKNVRNPKQSPKKQKPKQYYGFIKPVTQNSLNQETYYNPDDYADYYSGRILRSKKYRSHNANNNYKTYSLESNEEDHPVNSIPKSHSIKDYVKAARIISYLQNLGFVPQVSESPIIRKVNEFFRKRKKPKRPRKYKISMDSNRVDPEIDIKNELFRPNKSNFKPNMDINIVPLTPNPLYHETDSKNIPEQDVETENHSELINKEINDLPFKKLLVSMIVVLKDSIKVKNEKLVKYNWLETTVNIQAALRKLLDLIQQLKYGEHVHPKDLELIKYTIYLFKSSKKALEEESMNRNSNRKKDSMLKKSVIKFPKTKTIIKIKEPIKLWKMFATFLRSEEDEEEIKGQKNNLLSLLNDFENLLDSLLFNLNDLHDAIKHIAIITEYQNQNWLEDLNTIYLEKGNKKNIAKVILHLSLSRLLDSIEDSSSLVEENFRNFVKNDREIVKNSKEECLFVLNVLEELRRLNE